MSSATEFQGTEKSGFEKSALPKYVKPRIQAMDEKEILNSFQITQSMGGWWTTATC